ncbi:MAG TPA: TerB family tellurite resistance protein [Burkholderiales bacterium]|jgi:uncharacterized tellurite resistance protein B-like protein|nr:TerB family tellurite resistance protein [Burkholderiales bacterium]
MLDRFKALFLADADSDLNRPGHAHDELQLAAVALLVEAACADGEFDAVERQCIRTLIETRFGLAPDEAAALIEEATRVVEDSVQILRFTRVIKDRYSYAERVSLMEMLWDVVLADGVSDAFEAQLMRRLGGLLYVSDRDRGEARQRVLARREQGEPRSVA